MTHKVISTYMPVVTKDLIPSLSRQGLHTVDSMFVSVKQALTRCQKVKSRRERKIWNPYLEFREEKREMSRSVFWFEKRTRIFANKMEKF